MENAQIERIDVTKPSNRMTFVTKMKLATFSIKFFFWISVLISNSRWFNQRNGQRLAANRSSDSRLIQLTIQCGFLMDSLAWSSGQNTSVHWSNPTFSSIEIQLQDEWAGHMCVCARSQSINGLIEVNSIAVTRKWRVLQPCDTAI